MVLLHFDGDAAAGAPRRAFGENGPAPSTLDAMSWFGGCTDEQVRVLLPKVAGNRPPFGFERVPGKSMVWYGADGALEMGKLPEAGVWVVNGALLPMINWNAARAAVKKHRNGCDALVFGPPGAMFSSHYPESIVVDEAGQVQRVERHYSDSPGFRQVSVGPASFLFASGSTARAIIKHIVTRGWGLSSFRELAQRASVEWCEAPGVLSSLTGRSRAVGAINPFEATQIGDAPGAAVGTGLADSPFEPAPEVPCNPGYQWGKRAMDLAIAFTGLLLLSPLLIVVAMLIKLTSRGPVFFADRRQGLGGREFSCLKFRTMVRDAAARQEELRDLNEVDGPQFKITDDPRLTSIGPWLRRYNIDELPQLFNVLSGEMSLVGPRPSPDRENQLCPGWRRTRLSVKPGITGLWQVLRLRDAGPSDFQEWIYYDVEYARHRSLWLDWQILIFTPWTMFAPRSLDRLANKLAARGICTDSGRNRPSRETQAPGSP